VREDLALDAEVRHAVHRCPQRTCQSMSVASRQIPFALDLRDACEQGFKHRGVQVALGSDWLIFDPFEQLGYAAVIARLDAGGLNTPNAYDFLAMATIKAAEAIGLDDQVGSVQIGKRVDLILVDYDRVHISPINHHHDRSLICCTTHTVAT